MKATLVDKKLNGWRGSARLFQLSEGYEVRDRNDNVTGRVDHVVVSRVDVFYSGIEVFVFAADAKGEVLDWSELPGSRRGNFDFQEIADRFCVEVDDG